MPDLIYTNQNQQIETSIYLQQSKVELREFKREKPSVDLKDTTIAAQNFYYNFKFIAQKSNLDEFKFFNNIKIDTIGYIKDNNHNEIRFVGRANNNTSKDWLIGIVLFVLIIITWVRVVFKKVVLQMIKSTYNTTLLPKLFRERNSLYFKVSAILNITYVIILSLFIYEILEIYEISPFNYNNLSLFLLISVSILVVYLTKFIVYKILGQLFQRQKLSSELLHCHFLFHKTIGLLLFPLVASIPFIPQFIGLLFIKISIIIFILASIYRVFRIIIITIQSKLSIFYLILYLCTLEIIPILAIYKIFELFA